MRVLAPIRAGRSKPRAAADSGQPPASGPAVKGGRGMLLGPTEKRLLALAPGPAGPWLILPAAKGKRTSGAAHVRAVERLERLGLLSVWRRRGNLALGREP